MDTAYSQCPGEHDIGFLASFSLNTAYNGPIPHSQVINAGDCMEFLTGSFYKATIHRVVQPPPSQRQYTRLGVFYFAIPDDNTRLMPVSGSTVLAGVGVKRRFEDDEAPTAETWRKGRTAAYGKSELKKSTEEQRIEEEVINGVLVRHYN